MLRRRRMEDDGGRWVWQAGGLPCPQPPRALRNYQNPSRQQVQPPPMQQGPRQQHLPSGRPHQPFGGRPAQGAPPPPLLPPQQKCQFPKQQKTQESSGGSDAPPVIDPRYKSLTCSIVESRVTLLVSVRSQKCVSFVLFLVTTWIYVRDGTYHILLLLSMEVLIKV